MTGSMNSEKGWKVDWEEENEKKFEDYIDQEIFIDVDIQVFVDNKLKNNSPKAVLEWLQSTIFVGADIEDNGESGIEIDRRWYTLTYLGEELDFYI